MITIYHGELHNALEGLDVTKINSAKWQNGLWAVSYNG